MTQQETLNDEYESTGEIKSLSLQGVLCDLLSSALAEGKIEFITEEDEQRLLELDSSDLDDNQLYEEFNKMFGTNYVKDPKWKQMSDDNEKPVDVVIAPVALAGDTTLEDDNIEDNIIIINGDENVEVEGTPEIVETTLTDSDVIPSQSMVTDEKPDAKTQELIDILCSDDDPETDMLKTMAASMDFLQVLPDDKLAIKVPVVNYVKNEMEPNKEYVVMDKEVVNKLITENSEVCAVISKMTSDMGIKTTSLGLDSQVKSMLKLWFSLKANTQNIDKIVSENVEQKTLITNLNSNIDSYVTQIKDLNNRVAELTNKLESLGNVGSLQKPRYVISFLQPKTNQVVWLTQTDKGEFSPTKFSATLVLFEAFKFGDLDTVRKFLDLLIENVGKHGIPSQYLANIKVQEIMIKDCD